MRKLKLPRSGARSAAAGSMEDCIYRYTRACDEGDARSIAECFSDDGGLKWGCSGAPVGFGRQALYEYFRGVAGRAVSQVHYCTNQRLHTDGTDSARGECCMYSWQLWDTAGEHTTECFGRYEYQLRRESDGQWRIRRLTLVLAGKLEDGRPVPSRLAEHRGRPFPCVPDY